MTLEVIAPGALTLVEDLGREHPEWGIAMSGAADRGALALANRLVGNAPSAAALECLLGGLRLRCNASMVLAVTGADCAITVNGAPRDSHIAFTVSAGDELALAPAQHGLRAYLGVRGGIACEQVLGSRSRDVLALIGPPPLAVGDVLNVGNDIEGPAWFDHVAVATAPSPVVVRVSEGPRIGWFDNPSALSEHTWTVRSESDRTALRLQGEPLARRAGDVASEPTLVGAVQVPPDGQPIILGPDSGVSGGYPVIAVVWSDDLDLLAQRRPGDTLRLRWA